MSIESERDFIGLSRVGRVVALALSKMEHAIRPGMTTRELDEVAERVLDEHCARPTPRDVLVFPGASCISVNDEAVHGVPADRRIETNDVVKIDVTADLDGYVADAARTVVVEPQDYARQRLAWCAREAFGPGLAAARLGNRTTHIGAAIEREVRRGGFRVIRALCGHGVGRSVHEEPSVPNYAEPRRSAQLSRGLVITIEPIICAGNGRAYEAGDGWTVRTTDGSLAAHHEETIVITDGQAHVLTAV